MIFLLIAGLVTTNSDIDGKRNGTSQSSGLLADLRRQLMQDNYDYLPSESEEMFPLNRKNANHHRSPEKIVDDYDYHANDKLRFKAPEIVPRAHDEAEDNDDNVSKKDLLYYMNDERMGLGNNKRRMDYEDVDEYENTTRRNVKYRVLKLKPSDPSRRSLTARRFIEERGKDGVAILNLDDQPFPEFRLPKSRRQYMQEASDNDDTVSNFAEDFSFEDADN